jgi:hypothetical protein
MMALIEAAVISHLCTELHTANVFAERPKDPPAAYWLIEKTAAQEENHILQATIAVQSVSSNSLLEAAQMSNDAEEAMRRLILLENVGSSKLNSAYNYTDPETREYRYQAVFDINYTEGD